MNSPSWPSHPTSIPFSASDSWLSGRWPHCWCFICGNFRTRYFFGDDPGGSRETHGSLISCRQSLSRSIIAGVLFPNTARITNWNSLGFSRGSWHLPLPKRGVYQIWFTVLNQPSVESQKNSRFLGRLENCRRYLCDLRTRQANFGRLESPPFGDTDENSNHSSSIKFLCSFDLPVANRAHRLVDVAVCIDRSWSVMRHQQPKPNCIHTMFFCSLDLLTASRKFN
jgi:hypothetical protein